MFFLDILTLDDGSDWLSQNIGMELPLHVAYNPEESRSQNMLKFSVSLHQGNAKWSNITMFYDIISENIV
jgi:hypothetical protein